MAIDPALSAAISVQARKGVYSLLLGSGVSRAAAIPTGWEVVGDLIARVARAADQQVDGDPVRWYRDTFGHEPTYSTLLAELAPARGDRSLILRGYFEPTEEEREQHAKIPTRAHRAIARLVRGGYLRVVLSTNFDRLLEQALVAEGVTASVISSDAAIAGMTPLQHADCTVIKLHGDYLDLDTRNTVDELTDYSVPLNALLDQVLSEYGFIVCGWSGDWDTALRGAIVRNTRHRFATYWMRHGPLGERAQQIVDTRRAIMVSIANADVAFEQLEDRVLALDESRIDHPLTIQIGIATVKRLASRPEYRIRLADFVRREVTRVKKELSFERFPIDRPTVDATTVRQRLEQYEALAAPLACMLFTCCRWGAGESGEAAVSHSALERLASNPPSVGTINVVWQQMRLFPACLCLYASGLGLLAAARLRDLHAMLTVTKAIDRRGEKCKLVKVASARDAMQHDGMNILYTAQTGRARKTPGSDWIFERLKPLIVDEIGDEAEYEELFGRFELLLSMTHLHQQRPDATESGNPTWMPDGRYIWQTDSRDSPVPRFRVELDELENSWPPLTAGFFDQSPDRARDLLRIILEAWRSQRF